MKETCHSEYSNLLSVYLKPVKNAFRSEKELEEQWETLKYLSKPDFDISLKEYEEFILFLTSRNIQYHFFPENDKSGIDSIYCRDASIATNFGMIICNMGKKGRIYEPKAHKELYKKNEIKVLGEIKSPGT